MKIKFQSQLKLKFTEDFVNKIILKYHELKNFYNKINFKI